MGSALAAFANSSTKEFAEKEWNMLQTDRIQSRFRYLGIQRVQARTDACRQMTLLDLRQLVHSLGIQVQVIRPCLLYTSSSPRDS